MIFFKNNSRRVYPYFRNVHSAFLFVGSSAVGLLGVAERGSKGLI
jgi:hypothetical protein